MRLLTTEDILLTEFLAENNKLLNEGKFTWLWDINKIIVQIRIIVNNLEGLRNMTNKCAQIKYKLEDSFTM